MSISPHDFSRFLADNTPLVLSLFERRELSEADLSILIERHLGDASPTPEYVRKQLRELGFLEPAAHADETVELSQPIVDLFAWLTHRQKRSSAMILRAHLDEIAHGTTELHDAVQHGDANRVVLLVSDLVQSIDRVRQLSMNNRESVMTETQQLRAGDTELSAVERFAAVRRLWENHLVPLQQVVSVRGEMEQLLQRTRDMLEEAESRFVAHGPLVRILSRTRARLIRMRGEARDSHDAAVADVLPLYERLQQDSRWARGASLALAHIRDKGVDSLRLDDRLSLAGSRSKRLLCDDKARAYLLVLVGYRPASPEPIGEAAPAPQLALITQTMLRAAMADQDVIDDVLTFVLSRWPALPLAAQLCAFASATDGSFGVIGIATVGGPQRYASERGQIEAWPVSLKRSRP